MSVQSGFIRVYRSLQKHPLWTAEPFTRGQAWVDLLLMAEWREDGRGQVRHSLRFLAERWKWDKNRVDRFLEKLAKEDMISRQKERETGQGQTLITIVNYVSYQNGVEQSGTPVIRQRDTIRYADGTPTGHHFPYENDEAASAERAEIGTPCERKSGQKENEVKKSKNNNSASRESADDERLPSCLDNPDFRAVWADWKKHRTEKRISLTSSTAAAQLKRCAEIGNDRAISAVNFSIMQGYTGIYEPKTTAANVNGASIDPDEFAERLCDQIKSQQRNGVQ